MNDNFFIKKTIELAVENVKSGHGGPFAALIVKNGKIISTGVNSVTIENDPTAHAEIKAIRNACEKLNDYQLKDCIIYSSCEPCPMCLGAIYWSRPKKLIFAATKNDAASAGFDDSFIYDEIDTKIDSRHLETTIINEPDKFLPFKTWINFQKKIKY
ncbi:MAG: tRNA-specific adenosine deaminase [Bacteroidetes bacterium CG2_30_33_31]|nr:MAG: tRNA-specific adenosine deaminase [Bacteroidetes bacterium CG2_30_33_31]